MPFLGPLLGRLLMRGLIVGLPLVLTIAILAWFLTTVESWLAVPLKYLFADAYIPGMGLALGVLLAIGLGVVATTWIGDKLLALVSSLIDRVPLAKTVYGAIKDVLNMFNRDVSQAMDKAVVVEWGGRRFLGFVTRDTAQGVPAGLMGPDDVVVYLPMGYQIGGFPIVVPRDQLTPIDMSVDAALKFALTAGASSDGGGKEPA